MYRLSGGCRNHELRPLCYTCVEYIPFVFLNLLQDIRERSCDQIHEIT